ncbi:MAG: ABC transporter permease [Spirochaetes bacterium]|nr:ABC transporter permease [Spirochaetota bacterium]
MFPDERQVLHPKAPLIIFILEHLRLIFVSSLFSVLTGISLGILVTRAKWQEFKDPVDNLTAIGQTFPPVAILALSVPLLGFGFKPTIFALMIYGLLPVLRNTIAGINNVPPEVKEAACGMGYTPWQILLQIELPLSYRVILTGVRTSMIINVGTAAIGATIGSGGLGVPIIAGLVGQNPAFVLEGAIPAAFLAIIIDFSLRKLEKII